MNAGALKLVALAVLILQNVSLVLTMKLTMPDGAPPYLVTVVVLVTECTKLAICLVVVYLVQGKTFDWTSLLRANGLKVAVPALLYVVQNNLLFFAISRLEPAVFQVTYQLKIATTAVFSVTMLGRQLSRNQILGICILLPGVMMVQLSRISSGGAPSAAALAPAAAAAAAADTVGSSSALAPGAAAASGSAATQLMAASGAGFFDKMLGLISVLCSCVSSGFAGVYFEKVLKAAKSLSLWERNIQLACYSIAIAFISVIAKDGSALAERGPFSGFSLATLFIILLQAAGGLLIAVVVKYADNIAKAFATSVSVIISCTLSIMFFGFNPPMLFFVGAMLVGYAVYVYSSQAGEATTEFVFTKVLQLKPSSTTTQVLPK
jgi:UDP-sugar transporter A1/2/3